jgi:hypothetical protein
MKLHKRLLLGSMIVQVLLQHSVIQGHEVFGITIDRFWNWSEDCIYVVLILAVTYPLTWILTRRQRNVA